ncbi:hypothetical protein, partial [Rhodococcus sp. CX]|uniref:hypothetical protein n=1 Tax=Rhodococcus sp. CX TaxID=2789880 RepID=UPI001E2C3DB7
RGTAIGSLTIGSLTIVPGHGTGPTRCAAAAAPSLHGLTRHPGSGDGGRRRWFFCGRDRAQDVRGRGGVR